MGKKLKSQIIPLPKLSKIRVYFQNKSSKNLLQKPSLLNTSNSLLYPTVKDTNYMAHELDKIITQCNDDSFNNTMITDSIVKTEVEIKEIIGSIKKINEFDHQPRPKFRRVITEPEPTMNKSGIKAIVREMRRICIRIRAI